MNIFSFLLMIFTCTHCYAGIPLPHGDECIKNVNNCEAGTLCLPDRNNVSRCLCDTEQYGTQLNSCLSTSNLSVTDVKTKRVAPNSITLEWSNRTIYKKSAKIKVSYETTPYLLANDQEITINKLEQDTTYNFTVQVVIYPDAWYSTRDGPKYYHSARTTNKKYYGHSCNKTSDLCQDETSCVLDVNNISRCLSEDNQFRDDDNKCVSIAELTVKNVRHKLITKDSIQLIWCDMSFNKFTAKFNVSYGTGTYILGDSYGVTVNHLKSKTVYTFVVKVIVPPEDYYGIKSGPSFTLQIKTVSADNDPIRSNEPDCKTSTKKPENVISSSTSLSLMTMEVTTAKSSTHPVTLTQISDSVSTASNTNQTNTTMAEKKDSENIIISITVCLTVVILVVILLSLFYTHHRKKKNLQFRNSITSSGGTYKHVSYSISQECTYSEINQKGLRNSKETQKNGNECNTPIALPATNDYETAQSITYSEVNHLKKSQREHNGAEYSHLANISNQRSRNTENVYDG